MNILLSEIGKAILIPVVLVAFFGLLVLIIILVKRRVPSLQIKKDEISEEEAVQQELDRILVPVEDEELKEPTNDEQQKD